MEIQELSGSMPQTYFSFIHLADKSKLLLYSEYSQNIDYKKFLEEVLILKPSQIPDFHEIYVRIKAFSFKKLEIGYPTAFIIVLQLLSDEASVLKLDISYLQSHFSSCLNIMVISMRKCLYGFEGDRLSNLIQKIIENLIVPTHDLCFGSNATQMVIFDGVLNILVSTNTQQKKFDNMNFVISKGPKAVFFMRLFFNIALKLVRYSKFRASTKCWIKLLDLCFQLTKFFAGNKDLYPEIATQLLSDILKFLGKCFQTSTSVDRDRDPYQRENLFNEIALYIISNCELIAEYFYTLKDNVIQSFIHLTSFLVRNDLLRTFEKIDKVLLISALLKAQREVLRANTTNTTFTYLEEKEKICELIEVLTIVSPSSLDGLVTETNVKQLLLSIGSLKDLRSIGISPMAAVNKDNEKSSIAKLLMEPFMTDMDLNGLKSLLNYSNLTVNQMERPTIFSFLEKVQFSFLPKDVDTNKEIVQEILKDLFLNEDKCDPYYAKFCCFFILKIPPYAVPEGFCLTALFKIIFKTLSSHWTLLHDLLKNLSQTFYSLCFKGSLTQKTHIIDILQQLGSVACSHLDNLEEIFIKLKEEVHQEKSFYKLIGEFLELHHLLGWTLHFPLKIKQGFFEDKKKKDKNKKADGPVESFPIIRRFCKECGFRRQKVKSHQNGLEYCKYCNMYIETYTFKNYPGTMLEIDKVNAKVRESIEQIKEKGREVVARFEQNIRAQYGATTNLWDLLGNYEFVVWQVADNMMEFYEMF